MFACIYRSLLITDKRKRNFDGHDYQKCVIGGHSVKIRLLFKKLLLPIAVMVMAHNRPVFYIYSYANKKYFSGYDSLVRYPC